jgi:hypothetical protein
MTRPESKGREIILTDGRRFVKVPHFHQAVARTDANRLRAWTYADFLFDVGGFRSAREMVRVKARITRWFNRTKDRRRTRREPHPRRSVKYRLAGGRGVPTDHEPPATEGPIPRDG